MLKPSKLVLRISACFSSRGCANDCAQHKSLDGVGVEVVEALILQSFNLKSKIGTVKARNNFASFLPVQLIKQYQCIAESNIRLLNYLMGKFAGLDRLLFWLSDKFEKLVTQLGMELFALKLLSLRQF
ncbi:MAG: hypothetical protein V7K18_28880 [Nostoc sp.]|uniref:hypothetical protein n=1 Tax=Nostoc sp. TaxID=1180 RepID=UPI002FFBFBBC